MKNKLISMFMSILLIFQPISALATGEYYDYRELEKINPQMLIYKPVDSTQLTEAVSAIEKLAKQNGNDDKIFALIEQVFNLTCDIYNQYALATLSYDRNVNKENKINLDNISKQYIESTSILSDIVYILYDNGYIDLLSRVFGDIETALEFALPDDGELKLLLEQEVELTNKYSEIYADIDKCAELYLELVSVRNKIAKIYGYRNFAEYANECVYGRDVTDDELSEFNYGVEEYVYSLYYNSVTALSLMNATPVSMTEDDVLLISRSVAGKINNELLDAFDYMIENNLYDIKDSETKNKSGGAYTLYLPELCVPFMYINPYYPFSEDGSSSVSTCIHEFGHFAAMLNDPVMIKDKYSSVFGSADIETAEIHSQGLEALSERYFGRMYGSEAAYQRYLFLATLSWSILQGSIYNDWQTAVYSMENPTVDDVTKLLQDLIKQYIGIEYSYDDAKTEWTQLHHNYLMPMYYFSYALSGMTVLNLYSESITDFSGAVDKYMQISAEGIYKDFDTLIDEYELNGIYDKNNINRIYSNIFEYYGFSNYDLADGAWYVPYVYTVSNIMPAKSYGLFMPDMATTRSEFVGAIGRMYDYYVGIDGKYDNEFTDISENDNNAEYISWAAEEGIVEGYDDKTFGGNDLLTREQAATLLTRLSECIPEDELSIMKFQDREEISEWAKSAVCWMAENGIIEGRDNGEFDPKCNITRAETAKIITGFIDAQY